MSVITKKPAPIEPLIVSRAFGKTDVAPLDRIRAAQSANAPKDRVKECGQEGPSGGEVSVKKTSGEPVNRNMYESFGAGAADGGAVNRNAYEAMGPAEASMAKPGAGEGYVLLGKKGTESCQIGGEEAAPKEGEQPPSSESTTYTGEHRRRRIRRLMAAEEDRRTASKARTIAVVCTILIVVVVVIGAMVAGAWYLIEADMASEEALPFVAMRKHAVYGYEDCKDAYGTLVDPRCVFVERPKPKSAGQFCGQGSCKVLSFVLSAAASSGEPTFSPIRAVDTGRVTFTQPTFCRIKGRHEKTVCANGKCNYIYGGRKMPYGEDEAQPKWTDNCDEPSPCWGQISMMNPVLTGEHYKRHVCKTATCPSDNVTAAVIWIQHLHCESNPDGLGPPCEGLPVRLNVCKNCTGNGDDWKKQLGVTQAYHNEQACGGDEVEGSWKGYCVAVCRNENATRHVQIPNGAACQAEDASATRHPHYCYKGACLRATMIDPAKIQSVETCKENRVTRRPRFPVPKTTPHEGEHVTPE